MTETTPLTSSWWHKLSVPGEGQVCVMPVVRTRLLRKGKGKAPDDPIRIITQYWSLDGELLAEVDPWQGPDGSPIAPGDSDA